MGYGCKYNFLLLFLDTSIYYKGLPKFFAQKILLVELQEP